MRDDSMYWKNEGRATVQSIVVGRQQVLFVSCDGTEDGPSSYESGRFDEKPSLSKVNGMWTPSICMCGYQPKAADATWVDDYQVLHVRCYECGCEWVE